MQYLLSAQQMKTADAYTSDVLGIPSIVLMERAALHVAKAVTDRFPKRTRIAVLAGKGNNGADALAAGRLLLDKGYPVIFYVFEEETTPGTSMETQRKILAAYGADVRLFDPKDFQTEPFEVVLDGLFGVGLSRAVKEPYSKAIALCNQKHERNEAYVIAVDIPSGIHADTGAVMGHAVCADETITFGFAKRGQLLYPGATLCGKLQRVDIGITERSLQPLFEEENKDAERLYFTYEKETAEALLGKRSPAGHKGTFGKALIIAGSRNMSGACTMAASACGRMGCGMVKVFTADENRMILQQTVPEAMLSTWEAGKTDEALGQLEADLSWCDACAVGPGLGKEDLQKELVKAVLNYAARTGGNLKHLVIDADAIRIIAEENLYDLLEAAGREADVILTPHMAECAALLGTHVTELNIDKESKIKQFADRYHVTILCKDARSMAASWNSERIYLNTSGNEGLATAGSGDVLTGFITAISAQGQEGLAAAAAGSYLHGRAAEHAERITGNRGLVAPDLYTFLNEDYVINRGE